jgi:hypothetical protein
MTYTTTPIPDAPVCRSNDGIAAAVLELVRQQRVSAGDPCSVALINAIGDLWLAIGIKPDDRAPLTAAAMNSSIDIARGIARCAVNEGRIFCDEHARELAEILDDANAYSDRLKREIEQHRQGADIARAVHRDLVLALDEMVHAGWSIYQWDHPRGYTVELHAHAVPPAVRYSSAAEAVMAWWRERHASR